MGLSDYNPLEFFKELTLFPRTVFLLGFIVLFVGIAHGANIYNKTAFAGIAVIMFALSCQYFATSRWQDADEPYRMHFDWWIILKAVLMLIVAGGIGFWAYRIPVPQEKHTLSESAPVKTTQPEHPPTKPPVKPRNSAAANSGKQESASSFEPIQVGLNCEYADLPITIPAGKIAYVLYLNKALNTIRKAGSFSRISNVGQRYPLLWPDSLMQPGLNKAIGCDLKNHGKQNLTDMRIPIDTTYGESKDLLTYNAYLASLDRGESFSFYIVNPCPLDTYTHVPNSASAQVVGEPAPRPLTFERDNRGNITMGLRKGEQKWMGGNSCD